MKKIIILMLFGLYLFSANSYVIAQNKTTDEGSAIREKIKERIEAIRKNPKAAIGSVTDKTGDTIQVRDTSGEIKLISIDANLTTFLKVGKAVSTVKFADLAIGDNIVAMGYQNGSGVLEAKRILLTSYDPTKRTVISGQIETIVKKEVNLKDVSNLIWKLEFPKKWTGPEIKDLSTGDKIIVIGEVDGDVFRLRTLYVSQKAAKPSPSPSPTPTKKK